MRGIRAVAIALLAVAGIGAVEAPASAAPRPAPAAHRACSSPTPADQAVAYVQQQLGKPYVFGAAGPGAFDASGLVVAAYASAGITLPHGTAGLVAATTPVDLDHRLPGDLVFYGSDSPSTVAVYIGDGEIVGVFRPGTVVAVRAVDYLPIFGYGRVVSS